MNRYFRCGDLSGKCRWATTRDIHPESEWVCPSNNPNCEVAREQVSFFEVHRKKFLLAGLIGGSLLLILVAFQLFQRDPFHSDMLDLKTQVSRLETRLTVLEAKAPVSAGGRDSLTTLRYILARAEDCEEKIRNAVEAGQPELAAPEAKTLPTLPQQAKAARESARNPAKASGSGVIEAKALLDDFQKLQDQGDTLLGEIESEGRNELATVCETALQQIRGGMARVSGLLRSGSDKKPDEIAMTKLIKEIEETVKRGETIFKSYVPPVVAPFEKQEADLIIATTSDLGANLIVPLLKARSPGEAVSPDKKNWYFDPRPGTGGEKVFIQVTDGSPFDPLLVGESDLAVTGMKFSKDDLKAFTDAFPGRSLTSRSQTEVIGLGALTFLAHPDNTREEIRDNDLNSIEWIGGEAGTPEQSAAVVFGFQAVRSVSQRPADAVLDDPSLMGLGVFHNEGANIRAKRLAFRSSQEARPIKPSPFSIATEDYKFAFRIIASHSPKSRPGARKFVSFATSTPGQEVVGSQGYVDLRLRPIGGDVDPRILAAIGEALKLDEVKGAVRISTNLRFGTNKSILDIKAIADLERLPLHIAEYYPRGKVVILGFTDSSGGPAINIPLSRDRAEEIAKVRPG